MTLLKARFERLWQCHDPATEATALCMELHVALVVRSIPWPLDQAMVNSCIIQDHFPLPGRDVIVRAFRAVDDEAAAQVLLTDLPEDFALDVEDELAQAVSSEQMTTREPVDRTFRYIDGLRFVVLLRHLHCPRRRRTLAPCAARAFAKAYGERRVRSMLALASIMEVLYRDEAEARPSGPHPFMATASVAAWASETLALLPEPTDDIRGSRDSGTLELSQPGYSFSQAEAYAMLMYWSGRIPPCRRVCDRHGQSHFLKYGRMACLWESPTNRRWRWLVGHMWPNWHYKHC